MNAPRRLWLLLGWLALLVAVGCERSGGSNPQVCAGCKTIAGGETTSFAFEPQASLGPCYTIYQSMRVTPEQAQAQGYAIDEAEQRIEQQLQVSMHWRAHDDANGSPARGYEADTQARIRRHIVGVVAVHPDPTRCEGEPCSFEGQTCSDWLQLEEQVELEVLDGSLSATLQGRTNAALYPGADAEFNPDLVVNASADLTKVNGRLRVYPSLPEPYAGVVKLDAAADGSWGELQIVVRPAASDDAGEAECDPASSVRCYDPPSANDYVPLGGSWGLQDLGVAQVGPLPH